MHDRPPCWPEGEHCPNRCATRYFMHTVYGHTDLAGDFAGWRVRGSVLVAPGGGRLPVEVLRRLAAEAKGQQGKVAGS